MFRLLFSPPFASPHGPFHRIQSLQVVGNSDFPTFFCNVPIGYVEQGGDCLDDITNGIQVYPNAPELCDGFDNDCNEEVLKSFFRKCV